MDESKLQGIEVPSPAGLAQDVIVSENTLRPMRLPPGQARTRKWPVLDASGAPLIDMTRWRFKIGGLVERPVSWTWEEFLHLPRVRVFADFHCVTRWSRLGNLWEGVATREVLERAGVLPDARFVLVHGYDSGWTTNMPLEAFASGDALLADRHDGAPLPTEHGGPLRLVVPGLYAWKSAKWVSGVELLSKDQPGYWERGGYHMKGDPWLEERYRDEG